jgi:CheY-like chemotaxis protein
MRPLKAPPVATVLIVEDESDLRESLALQCRRRGYNVLTAANGEEGLELVNTTRVDVVLSDVQMPVVSGPEMLLRLKAKRVALPIFFFMTGFSPISDIELIKLGANAVFAKPFDTELIFTAIDEVWER